LARRGEPAGAGHALRAGGPGAAGRALGDLPQLPELEGLPLGDGLRGIPVDAGHGTHRPGAGPPGAAGGGALMKGQPTDSGMNRTGVQIAPKLAKEMEEGARKVQPPPGDEGKIAEVRNNYHSRATPVGTMPPPGTMKGMAKAVGKALKGEKATALLDKLGERLAFERTGVRLYEAMITKVLALGELDDIGLTEEALRHLQAEELEHMYLVHEAIENMGADPTVQTPCADVVGVQAEGLMQVLVDPRTTIAQGLGAILNAELVDNASW